MNGKNLRIKVGGSVVALALDCEVSESLSLKETSTIASGKAKTYKADMEEWKVTCSHLTTVATYSRLRGYYKGRVPVSVTFEIDEGNNTKRIVSGNAIITRLSTTGAVNRVSRLSAEFTGTGELS